MNFNETRTAAVSGLLLKTGAIALFAGFSLSLAVSAGPRLFLSGQQVKVDLERWRWLGKVELGIQSSATIQAEQAQPTPIAQLVAETVVAKPVIARKPARRVRAVKKINVLTKIAHVDRVSIQSSAPTSERIISLSERARLRGVYGLLRGRFHAALSPQTAHSVAQLTTQPAIVLSSHSKAAAKLPTKSAAKRAERKTQTTVGSQKASQLADRPQALGPSRTPTGQAKVKAPVLLHEIKPISMNIDPSVDSRSEAASAITSEHGESPSASAESNTLPPSSNDIRSNISSSAPGTLLAEPKAEIARTISASEQQERAPAISGQWVSTQATVTTLASPKSNGYSAATRVVYGPWPVATPPGPATVVDPIIAADDSKKPDPEADDSVDWGMSSVDDSSDDESADGQLPEFVEAYRWEEGVPSVSTEWISRDLDSRRGWALHRSVGFVPMIAWHAPEQKAPVPLLSHNSALSLARLADVDSHPALGMVFGKIPAGWAVELSGRAEQPVFINGTFAFLNVEPGARILYLSKRNGAAPGLLSEHDETAIGIPVLAGKATFVDIVEPRKRSIAGRVLKADEQGAHGLDGIQVSVPGQSNTAITDRQGLFSLSNVGTIGSYPIYLEAQATTGFTHRYTFDPDSLDSVELFHFSAEQVDLWLRQVEGDVSFQSGLVVGALKGLTAKHCTPGTEFYPGVAPLIEGILAPESYVLSPEGEMLAATPMAKGRSRFVSLEIPEGPVVAFFGDKQGRRWSELIVSQRGVINVIGPR